MDPITEEVITSLIKRVEALEKKQGNNPTKSPEATIGQIKFIKGLGGEPWEGMTKKEASQLIDSLQKKKSTPKYPNVPQKQEPKQDQENQKNPLTQKEIDEIGEDALL